MSSVEIITDMIVEITNVAKDIFTHNNALIIEAVVIETIL